MSTIDSDDLEQPSSSNNPISTDNITLHPYTGEHQMASIIDLIQHELSEPYIVYTYRYFVNQWPSLCFFAHHPSSPAPIGVIVCKLDRHLKGTRLMRGYIAMISVHHAHRKQGLAKRLVKRGVTEMVEMGAQEVVLETEADNEAALRLYEGMGFVREKRLHRFYLNGKDSFRLVLPVPKGLQRPIAEELDTLPPVGLVQPPYADTEPAKSADSPSIEHDQTNTAHSDTHHIL